MNHSPSSPKHRSKQLKGRNKALRGSCEPHFRLLMYKIRLSICESFKMPA
jgi:hypothetical protein